MVSAVVRVDVRGSAELAGHDDERRVEQAPLFEVAKERGGARIEHRHQPLRSLEVVLVRVPTVERDFDEGDAHLDEAARREASAPEIVIAVRGARLLWFALDVERAELGRLHHLDGAVVHRASGFHFGVARFVGERRLERCEKLLSVLEAIAIDHRGKIDVVGRLAGAKDERRVLDAEKSPAEARTADAHETRKLERAS
jgi:hypothetical protein